MRSVQIYDTTLRDGAQGEGVSFSLFDKLQIAKRLDEAGVDFIEGGFPGSNEKDAEFFQRAPELGLQHAKVCAFGMTRRKGIAAADDPGMQSLAKSGAPVCTLVGKTWDFHVTEVLRVSLEENLAMISDSIAFLASQPHVEQVMYDAEHFFDGWTANPDYAAQTIQAAAKAGASMIIACDTNGGSLPGKIVEILKEAMAAVADFDVQFGIHCHNDSDVAIANSLAAVDAGAVQVQGTINGIGERCGNADLISTIANLSLKKGYDVLGGKVEHLTELSRFVYETANINLRTGQPFVGQSAFAHKGGMHVHAVERASSSYEHINPEKVGNERRILVSELSGRSNIVALTTRHNLENNRELQQKILDEVVARENRGFQFEAAEASFDLLVKRIAGTYDPHFERLNYHVNVGSEHGKDVTTEATVKIVVKDETRHEVGEGDGPVNALDAALRKALNGSYPALKKMRLVDYKVRVVNSEAGTAARIRVSIESADENDVWGTIGVHENIIEASWMALNDAIEYKLYKDERDDA